LAILAVLFVVMGLTAFESHLVNVRAHVVTPLSQEIVDCQAEGPNGWETCPEFLAVPEDVPLKWRFQIHIHNPLEVPLTGVQVTEEFAPQVFLSSLNGSHAGSLTTSYPGDPSYLLLQWNLPTLAPGVSYTLDFDVKTNSEPPEFVDPGDVILATGALMTGTISGGSGFTATTAPIHIVVLDPPDGLEINTDIDFGIVFPQTTRTDYFKVCLSKTWCGCGGGQTKMDYKIVLNLKPLECGRCGCHDTKYYPDLRPYLIVQRDPAETGEPAEPDGTAGGADFIAQGHLDSSVGDKCDKWLVTMNVPVFAENYNPETDPIPPEEVLILPPEADPNGWDLGADISIEFAGKTWWWWLWQWWR
jgi:hypothetical protein